MVKIRNSGKCYNSRTIIFRYFDHVTEEKIIEFVFKKLIFIYLKCNGNQFGSDNWKLEGNNSIKENRKNGRKNWKGRREKQTRQTRQAGWKEHCHQIKIKDASELGRKEREKKARSKRKRQQGASSAHSICTNPIKCPSRYIRIHTEHAEMNVDIVA